MPRNPSAASSAHPSGSRSTRIASTRSPPAPAIGSGFTSTSSAPNVKAHSAAPIAHGYLTLSLVAAMIMERGVIPPDAATGLNYGLDKVRLITPVKGGSRVRARAKLRAAEPQGDARVLLRLDCTLEIEGEAKPALIAELLCLLIGKCDPVA